MQMVSTDASPAPEISFVHMLAGLVGMLLADMLLVWQPEALLTRWHPAALASVHLYAVAGLMPVMLGALFQFVPVACGLSLPRWGLVDWLILAALWMGALALASAFLVGIPALYMVAASLLLGSLAAAGWRLARALWRQVGSGVLVANLRRSALALAGTVCLAVLLLGILIAGWNLPLITLVDWHALWALAGWVGGLIGSVAAVVVPMFHVTAPYPKAWEWSLRALLPVLLGGLVAALAGVEWLSLLARLTLVLWLAVFGALTAHRILGSRRGEHDAFHWGWLGVGGLAMLLAGIAVMACFSADLRWSVVFGILALAGFGGGTVSVMLYRIVPFLIWLHWQRANKARARLPLLHQIVPDHWQRAQLAADGVAAALLCGGTFEPVLVVPGALLAVLAKLAQIGLLARAMRDYRVRLAVLQTLPPRVRQPS